jgi:glucose-6-phosphate isomerase
MQGRTIVEARAELAARGTPPADIERLAPHLVMPGNRPSNTISMRRVEPETLGALLALYEHRTAVEGILWDLNSFDQFGVELGKQIGETVHRALGGDAAALGNLDASAVAIISEWRALNGH